MQINSNKLAMVSLCLVFAGACDTGDLDNVRPCRGDELHQAALTTLHELGMNKNCERRGCLPALRPSSSTRLHYDQHWYPGALCARLFNRQSSSRVGTPVACEVNLRALCGYCLRSLIRVIMWDTSSFHSFSKTMLPICACFFCLTRLISKEA